MAVRSVDKALAASIGARARVLRTKRSATQEQVAEWIGLASQVYSRLERGEMLPSLPTLVRMAQAFGVSPADFFEAFDGPNLREPDDVPAAKGRQKNKKRPLELNEIFARLDPSTQVLVLALVRHLARPKKR